jgi:hypothetical protein
MKKLQLVVALLLTFAVPPSIRAAEPAPAATPLATLASFVGGVWSGDLPREKDGPEMKIELRFTWAENKRALRFDSFFVQGDKRSPYTSGMYGWNPATKKFVIFYTDNSGSLVEGPVTPVGDMLVHELTIIDAKGKVDTALVRLARESADAFTNTIYLRKNDAWEKFVEVHYVRHS